MVLFSAKFPSFKILDMLLKSAEPLNDMIYILPEEDGIRVKQIDKPRVVFINNFINEKDLIEYNIDPNFLEKEEENRIVPLVIKDLKKALKVAKKDSIVQLELSEGNWAIVTIEGQYYSKSKLVVGSLSDWIPVGDIDIEFPSTIRVYGKLLKDMLSLAKSTTPEFNFEVTEEGLKFVFEGMNIEQEIVVPYDSELILDVEAEVGAKGIYGVGYLQYILRSIEAGDVLIVEWGEDMPMHIKKNVLEHSFMEWYIAPRVEDE